MEDTNNHEIEQLKKKPGWTLRRERKKLILALKEKGEAKDEEYKAMIMAVQNIDKVLTGRWELIINGAKVVTMAGITMVGLALTYSVGDKGDSLPNKNTGKFVDSLMGFFRR